MDAECHGDTERERGRYIYRNKQKGPLEACINLYEPQSSGARTGHKVNSVCVLYGFIMRI